jgi:hypothetical protein
MDINELKEYVNTHIKDTFRETISGEIMNTILNTMIGFIKEGSSGGNYLKIDIDIEVLGQTEFIIGEKDVLLLFYGGISYPFEMEGEGELKIVRFLETEFQLLKDDKITLIYK